MNVGLGRATPFGAIANAIVEVGLDAKTTSIISIHTGEFGEFASRGSRALRDAVGI